MEQNLKTVVAEIKKAQALLAPVFALGDSIEKSFAAIESLETVSVNAESRINAWNKAVAEAKAEREKAEGLLREVRAELSTAKAELDASRSELGANEKKMAGLKAELDRLARL